jgi:NADPH-dependent glutamate synthase beta subunit-like oxidoreductase
MAVVPTPRHDHIGAPDRTPNVVPVAISVTDEFPSGIAGFIARWRSLLTGVGITGRRAAGPNKTLQYPAEKVSISPRWRGALKLRGVLGRDEIPILTADTGEHNALIDSLYRADRLAPCTGACPANVDARGQNYYLADEKHVEAYELVRDRNIMPGVLGRICHHPCEQSCRRNYYDEPIAIRPLHRVAYEGFMERRPESLTPFEVTQHERIVVIGSGPSGLCAAYDLMKLGYSVTAFEKEPMPGGALYSGVPAYRLPREVLHGEIDMMIELGLDLRCGVDIGTDVPIDHLIGEFDAVLIAVGLQESRIIPVPGHDAEGVRGAIEFLKEANWKGDAGVKGQRVLVIGGGNVAVDVARCALRTGATEVRLACLEGDEEMPCHPWEIEEALDEGVIAMCSLGPQEVMTEDGRVVGMRMRECLSVFDEAGRFAPQYGDEYTTIDVDTVVFAVGQGPVLAYIVGGSDLMLTERGLLPVDGSLFTTEVPGVFACGEVVTGPGSAIGSIATGHEAATSIHRYLRGIDLQEGRVSRPVPVYDRYEKALLDGVEESRQRVELPMARAEERAHDFRQVEQGYTHLEGLNEAARCLRCQSEVCVGCTFCARTCPDYCIQVERIDDPGERSVTHYELDLAKCSFCGLCAEQCPTDALCHTGQYELSFYHRDLMDFDRHEMLRSGEGSRATGREGAHVRAPGEEAGPR